MEKRTWCATVKALLAMIGGIVLLCVIPWAYFHVVHHAFDACTDSLATSGQFGDMFGALNAVCSLIAAMGLLVALHYQYQQNKLSLTIHAEATHAQSMQLAWEILQSNETRRARKRIQAYGYGNDTVNPEMMEKLNEDAEVVCMTYDFIAIMIADKMINKRSIVSRWGASIVRCWDISSEYVKSERDTRPNPKLWRDFEKLAEETRPDFLKTVAPKRRILPRA